MISKFLEADICNTMIPVYSLIRQTQSIQIPDENLVHLFLKIHSERKKKKQQQLQRLGFGDNGQQNAKDKNRRECSLEGNWQTGLAGCLFVK
jgi:hypothetical protein